mmetsp:Transcript_39906/g.128294  ORF Transcript_39906/g.128294 Transcript_39906/m.128294 type:complete len:220 (-) Transcript_39906:387-1046(-)
MANQQITAVPACRSTTRNLAVWSPVSTACTVPVLPAHLSRTLSLSRSMARPAAREERCNAAASRHTRTCPPSARAAGSQIASDPYQISAARPGDTITCTLTDRSRESTAETTPSVPAKRARISSLSVLNMLAREAREISATSAAIQQSTPGRGNGFFAGRCCWPWPPNPKSAPNPFCRMNSRIIASCAAWLGPPPPMPPPPTVPVRSNSRRFSGSFKIS